MPVRPASRALALLADAHLIEERSAGRYECHDLLRAYVAELAADFPDRSAATVRLLDFYLHTAYAAGYQLDPLREWEPLAPVPPGVTPLSFDGEADALRWLDAEHRTLLAVVRHAASQGHPAHAWLLVRALVDFLHRRGHWHDQIIMQALAVAAAEELGNDRWAAIAERSLGHGLIQLQQLDDAHRHLERALDLFVRIGNRVGQAYTEVNIGWLLEQQKELDAALRHTQAGYELHESAGDTVGQAIALSMLGWQHGLLGEYDTALDCGARALAMLQKLGDRFTEAGTWGNIGWAHYRRGEHPQAIAAFEQSRRICREVGERHQEAVVLDHLGDIHLDSGELDAAGDAWRQALAILIDMNHPDAESVRQKMSTVDS